jgi:hypothetical protein
VRALHGIWSADSRLCIWAEDSFRASAAAPHPGARAIAAHPFAAGAAELRQTVASVAPIRATAEPAWLTLLLPTGPAGPLRSPELPQGPDRGQRGRPRLRRWTVPALTVEPNAALDLLLALPTETGPGLRIGASLRFLGEACKLAMELTARGRLLPGLVQIGERGGPRTFEARWRAVPDADDGRRLRLLAGAMPPIVRAELGADGMPGAHAGRLLTGVLDGLVDAAARSALRSAPGVDPVFKRGRSRAPVVEAWLRALTDDDPIVEAADMDLLVLKRALDQWQHGAVPEPGALRLCFRVVQPEREGRPWRVEFLLQAPDEPSLLVPASEVWDADSRLVVAERTLEDPQERLLAELGRASLLWPDLETALAEPRPEEIALDVERAHRFLRDSATLLAHSGFGVLVPPWWHEQRARLGVRLRARARAGAPAKPGRLGQEAICDYRWEVALGDETLAEDELRALARLKVPLVQVRGRWVELRPEELGAALALLERQAESGDGEMRAAELLRASLGLDAPAEELPVLGVDADGWAGDLLATGGDRRLEPVAAPSSFHGTLRPYQERGLAWLRFLGDLGLGACLADDMGLGKTVQLLALLAAEREDGQQPAPTLLVCPMSLVGNWQREAQRFAPDLRVHVHHGGERLADAAFAEAAADFDLVVTTYGTAARDQETLAAVHWGRVVLDEAQNIKNSAARQTQAVRALPAAQRVALTGTPVENRLQELWSIMQFLNHGLLGSAEDFRRRVAVPIERYRDEAVADLLKRVTEPFVLRRLKTDRTIIADLPEKVEMKVYCNITREQATLYQAILDDMLAKIDASEGGIERRGLVLATMMKLKQVLNHPAQLFGDGSRLEGRSGKLSRLEETLEEVLAEGDRALLFTQFAAMGTLLEPYLRERFGREVLFLHGGTPKRARDDMVARFQADGGPPIFVLSLKAGGFGLNLTAASHVIHFDRWWNPAVEDQATDRAFRIGQRRDVQVRKFVCVGTLEERIDQVIEEKRELARRIVGTGEGWLTELSTAQLRELVALSAEAVAEA